jgi:beta-mannosidase
MANFGKGINWDTHGPWSLPFTETDKTWSAVENYWQLDDALMHSEVGVAGASSAALINKYRGDYDALPANHDNPLWNRFNWWIEWEEYLREHQWKAPATLEEYVSWSQVRQTKGLTIALEACKRRFPECGGFIIWMGHDSYPCTANTSIIDFDGNPKPAAVELSKIWKTDFTKKK